MASSDDTVDTHQMEKFAKCTGMETSGMLPYTPASFSHRLRAVNTEGGHVRSIEKKQLKK